MPIDKVVISGFMYGQLIQNRIYVQSEVFQEVDEVAAHIWNSWINAIRQLQHNALRYNSVQVQRIEGGPLLAHTETRSVFGAQAAENANTSFTCAVLQFQTGLSGRKFRGRYYCAAPRMGASEFGLIRADELAIWQQQIALLSSAYLGPDGGSTGLGLLIRGESTVHNTPVTNIAIRPIFGVQRRRNIGVGS